MSIAEKLITVAENQQRVYDAGHKAAIELYCPNLTQTGAVVTHKSVGIYPLKVISNIMPVQSGEGDHSPTNPRPITGHTAVKVTVSNGTETAEYNTEFGQTAYCGSFDWSTGLLTLTHKLLTLTGQESVSIWKIGSTYVYTTGLINDHIKTSQEISGWCSHVATAENGSVNYDYLHYTNASVGGVLFGSVGAFWPVTEVTAESWVAYLAEQYDAGTPVQILYKLGTPITVQLAPTEILSLSGTNTIQSDTGDSTVTGKVHPVERYCPEITQSGATVECNPAENYPLDVVSNITPIQAGSGDASPTNVRPLTPHTAVKVTITNGTDTEEHNADLGQAVYAGNFNWSTGLLTLTHKMQTLTGNENGWVKYSTTTILNHTMFGDSTKNTSSIWGYCSHVKTETSGGLEWNALKKANVNSGFESKVAYWGLPDNEVTTWTNYLKEQMLNGTPVQFLYQLETPIIVQLTEQEILSLTGTNTVSSDTGDTTVTFKADPISLVAQLGEAIISLGGDI